jgi:hypothetical protein
MNQAGVGHTGFLRAGDGYDHAKSCHQVGRA